MDTRNLCCYGKVSCTRKNCWRSSWLCKEEGIGNFSRQFCLAKTDKDRFKEEEEKLVSHIRRKLSGPHSASIAKLFLLIFDGEEGVCTLCTISTVY